MVFAVHKIVINTVVWRIYSDFEKCGRPKKKKSTAEYRILTPCGPSHVESEREKSISGATDSSITLWNELVMHFISKQFVCAAFYLVFIDSVFLCVWARPVQDRFRMRAWESRLTTTKKCTR